MSTTVEVNVKVQGAKKAADEVSGVGKAADESTEAVGGMTNALDRMTGGMVTAFKGVAKGLKSGVMGLKSFKMALISTGIGALVVAVGSLVTYFTKTQAGAEKLEVITSSLGAVFGVVTDTVSALGEYIFNAFNDPQSAMDDLRAGLESLGNWFSTLGTYIKDNFMNRINKMKRGLLEVRIAWNEWTGDYAEAELLQDALAELNREIDETTERMEVTQDALVEPFVEAAKAVQGFVKQASEAAAAGGQLAKDAIALRKAQRDLKVEFAESRAQIKEYNKIAEDTTKGTRERMEAATKAIEIEQGLMAERQRIAAEEVRIHKAQMALSESTEEDYERLAELESNLISIRMESAEMQTTLTNKLNTIRQQAKTEAEAAAKAEQDLLTAQEEAASKIMEALQTAEQNEIDAVNAKYDALFDAAYQHGLDTTGLIEQQQAEVNAVYAKYRKEEQDAKDKDAEKDVQRRQKTMSSVMGMAQALNGFLMALSAKTNDADKEEQKKAFKRSKGMQIGAALMSTASAVIAALSAPPVGLGFPAGLPGSITAGLTGAAQIATIAKQKFPGDGGGGASGAGGVSTPNLTTATVPDTFASSVTSPTETPQFEPDPVQAYVVSTEVTSQQQIDAELAHRSTL